jgi:hypothetical protein
MYLCRLVFPYLFRILKGGFSPPTAVTRGVK